MTSEVQPSLSLSKLMHETLNQLTTIISIAQFNLISEDMSPKLQNELKRIIQTTSSAADNLKRLAEILHEEE